jgi:hypothetical protein
MGICTNCDDCCISLGERDLAASYDTMGWAPRKPVLRFKQLAETSDVQVGDLLPEDVEVTGQEASLIFATRESVSALIQSLEWIEDNWDAMVKGVLDAKSE